ncbi:MAG: MFS transporter [Pseudomonadales bacterium]|nr:MFS transporter [Pseudomonadales bacterium]
MLGLFMVLPVLSLHAVEYRYSTPAMIGLALGAYGFTQAFLQIPFGLLSDRIGRKPVIIGGLCLFVVGSVVAAMSETIYGVIAGRFLQGSGAIASTLMALLSDLTSEQHRTKAMASVGASIGVSFAIALVLGPVISSHGGMSSIFWATALFAFAGILAAVFIVPTPKKSRAQPDAIAVPSLVVKSLQNPDLMRLNLSIFMLHFILMSSFVVVPVILRDHLGIAANQHWKIYLMILGCSFLAMLPLMIVAEKKRKIKPVFLLAIAGLFLSMIMQVFAMDYRQLMIAALFLFFLAFNLLEALLPSLVSKMAFSGSKGTAMGLYSSCQFLGAFLGGVSGGWLHQHYSPALVFTACSLMITLWFAFAWSLRPPRYFVNLVMHLEQPIDDDGRLYQQLLDVEGVVDAHIDAENRKIFLKVEDGCLDIPSLRLLGVQPA